MPLTPNVNPPISMPTLMNSKPALFLFLTLGGSLAALAGTQEDPARVAQTFYDGV
jgi:hypothetical protein